MSVRLHPHAVERMAERGASEAEMAAAVEHGERFAARFSRTGFRRNFAGPFRWRGRTFGAKQIEAIAVEDGPD
jgi:hypothetical protein